MLNLWKMTGPLERTPELQRAAGSLPVLLTEYRANADVHAHTCRLNDKPQCARRTNKHAPHRLRESLKLCKISNVFVFCRTTLALAQYLAHQTLCRYTGVEKEPRSTNRVHFSLFTSKHTPVTKKTKRQSGFHSFLFFCFLTNDDSTEVHIHDAVRLRTLSKCESVSAFVAQP